MNPWYFAISCCVYNINSPRARRFLHAPLHPQFQVDSENCGGSELPNNQSHQRSFIEIKGHRNHFW